MFFFCLRSQDPNITGFIRILMRGVEEKVTAQQKGLPSAAAWALSAVLAGVQ